MGSVGEATVSTFPNAPDRFDARKLLTDGVVTGYERCVGQVVVWLKNSVRSLTVLLLEVKCMLKLTLRKLTQEGLSTTRLLTRLD